ncbi:MAG: transcription antitermination factor NusB [Planctomycetes bacterium]|nr:transcription antitermination factor NusB [Planctomycetota bacterium]
MPRPIDSIARELALQYLYCRDVWKGEDAGFPSFASDFPTARRASDRAGLIVSFILSNQPVVDEVISETADNWPIHRMSIICRNILRIGAAELIYRPNVPFKVVIDEAVELAKRYDADASGSFINGILDRLARRFRADEVGSDDSADADPS